LRQDRAQQKLKTEPKEQANLKARLSDFGKAILVNVLVNLGK